MQEDLVKGRLIDGDTKYITYDYFGKVAPAGDKLLWPMSIESDTRRSLIIVIIIDVRILSLGSFLLWHLYLDKTRWREL